MSGAGDGAVGARRTSPPRGKAADGGTKAAGAVKQAGTTATRAAKQATAATAPRVRDAAGAARAKAGDVAQTLTPDRPAERTAAANKESLAALAGTVGRRGKAALGGAGSTVADTTRAATAKTKKQAPATAQAAVSVVKEQAAPRALAAAGAVRDGTAAVAAVAGGAAGAVSSAVSGAVAAAGDRLRPAVDLEGLAQRVLKVRGVVRLAPDSTGRAEGFLPGHVAGTSVDSASLTVRIVARYGEKLPALADRVHRAAQVYAAGRTTYVEVADLDLPPALTMPAGGTS